MSKKSNKSVEIQGKYNRTFSEEFKRTQVKALAARQISVGQLCKLHGISRTSVYKWKHLYSPTPSGTKLVIQMESEQHTTLLLQAQVAEYERIIGQKQMGDGQEGGGMLPTEAALEQALSLRGIKDYEHGLIHLSDRGSQYISDDYTGLLDAYNIRISMCRNCPGQCPQRKSQWHQ